MTQNADYEALIEKVAEAIYKDQIPREGLVAQFYSASDWYYEAKVAVDTVLAHIGSSRAGE